MMLDKDEIYRSMMNLPHQHSPLGVVDFRVEEEAEEVDRLVEEEDNSFPITMEMLVIMRENILIQR